MFDAWITAQRRRFRGSQAVLLEHLVARAAARGRGIRIEKWLELAPFDRHVHELLLTSLARQRPDREGEEHLRRASKAVRGRRPRLRADARDRGGARARSSAQQTQPGPALELVSASLTEIRRLATRHRRRLRAARPSR